MTSCPSFFLNEKTITEFTYTQMGGVARHLSFPSSLKEVQETIEFCQSEKIPCALLGAGSNSVYSDDYFDGVILSFEKLNNWFWETPETLFVQAGVSNTEIAEICALENRAGASWMYRMPGQIGGTIRMNARCYGGEISQIAKEIIVLTKQGHLVTLKGEDVFIGYKDTILMQDPHIVVGARLFFPEKEDAYLLLKHMLECEADRHSKKHFYLPSCGSTFKNNYEIGKPSGQIFDELGLKGTQIGNSAVSEFHGNFIWNCGQAKTEDMLNLSAKMKGLGEAKYHKRLDLEVQPVGVFSSELYEKCGMEFCGPSHERQDKKKWMGLFYYPHANANSTQEFPKTLFSSPFFEYHLTSLKGILGISVQIIQLKSLEEARKNPTAPFLKWETICTGNVNDVFALQHPYVGFVEELWKYSVSEVFFAHPQKKECYLEFEVTPNKNWIAIKFEKIRQPVQEKNKFNLDIFSDQEDKKFNFGIVFTYENLTYAIDHSCVLMQCALSLGNSQYYLSPFWKEDKEETPNFHQPQKFWKLNLS